MCHASEEVAMKKVLIIALMIVSVSFVFAAGGDGLYSGVTDFAFRPLSLDRERDLNYSLFGNAAALAEGGFRIQVPYFESSSYNVAEALKDSGVAEALSGTTSGCHCIMSSLQKRIFFRIVRRCSNTGTKPI